MKKIKKNGRFSSLVGIVRRIPTAVLFVHHRDQVGHDLPPLLTLQQTSAILRVHPNTLRAWDTSGRLRAVRIGSRQDRRYQRTEVLQLFETLHPQTWSTRIYGRIRPVVQWRVVAGVAIMLLIVSFTPQPAVRADTQLETVTLYPTVCSGWHNPQHATNRNTAANGAPEPAAGLALEDVAVKEGVGTLSGVSSVLGCTTFQSSTDVSQAVLKGVKLVWNQSITGTTNSLDVVHLKLKKNATSTSILKIIPLDAASIGAQTIDLGSEWSVTELQQALLQFSAELGSADNFTIAVNNLHFEIQVEPRVTVPVAQPKNEKTKNRNITSLVNFSQTTYRSSETPALIVPKKETKKFLFFKVKEVQWTLDQVEMIDADDAKSKPKYHTSESGSGGTINSVINLDLANHRPGKYRVKITMHSDDGSTAIVEKDFLWGVVAVNFDRAAPQIHEQEKVGISILDDKGRTLCSADLTVQITDPRGRKVTYRSRKKTIAANPNCVDKSVTNEPDYHFSFTPHLTGTYHLSLKAKTEVGNRTYEDNLVVAEHQPFDVQRTDYPTRINPYAGYPVRIAVTPRRDYAGIVYERVPLDFKIQNLAKGTTVDTDPAYPGMKRIGWEVTWKSGSTYFLTYKFIAPVISPALFKTGPISMGGNDLVGAEYIESRQWQIASDSASAISWDGSASTLWSNPANWSTNALPQAGDNLVFPAGAANYSNTNDLGENYWFNSITFYDSGYTLSGNTIILGQGQTGTNIILPGVTDAVSSGGNIIALNLRLDWTRLITVSNASETLTISGAIAGIGGFTKEGFGELVLTGANSYGGVTKVNVGSLSARNSRALGTIVGGTEVAGEAALELQGTIAIGREALTIRGYGQSNGGSLRNVQNNNSFAGQITINGTTEIASDSGTLTLSGGVAGAYNLNLDGAGDINFTTAPIAIAAGLLTKNGSGTVELDFPNTYTGLTTVNAGTLLYGCDNALMTGGITVNGGTVDIATFSDMQGTITLGTLLGGTGTITGSTGVLSSATYTVYAGTISAIIAGDAGAMTKSTFGTVTLTRPNQFTGAVTVSVGILKIQDSLALGTIDGATSVTSGASLQIDGSGLSVPEFITISGVGLLNQGALFNTTGNNAVTGLVTLGAASSIESATGTTLTFSNSGFTGAFGLTFDIIGNVVVSAPIQTTTGALIKNGAGTLTLSAYNSYTGSTTVNFGTLTLNGNGSITTSASITINSGSKLIMDNSSTAVDRVGDAVAVTMNGGDIDYYGSTSSNTLGILGALTMSGGQNTITVFAGSGGYTILRFASLTRTAGASGLFRGASLGDAPGPNVATIRFTTAPTLVGDDGAAGTPTLSIIPGIFGDDSTSGSGTDMVTYGRGNNNGVRLLNGAGFSNEYTSDYLLTNANVKLSSPTAAATTQINSLILGSGAEITDAGTAQTMTFRAGNILNLDATGSIAGANTTLAGGTIEMFLRSPQALDVSANITTSGGLTKSGVGTTTFSAAKTYTGKTAINAGTLLYGVNDAINTGDVTVHDATLDIATYTDSVAIVIVQGGTLTGTSGVLTGTAFDFRASTINAIIAGSGAVTISNTNERTDAETTMSRDNTYTGATSIASGILKLGGAGGGTNTPLGTTAGTTSISNGAMLDLNGYTLGTAEAINTFRGTGIAGLGAIINSSATPVTYSGALTIATSARIGADFGKITISGNISGATLPLTVGGFGDIDITGVIGTTSGTVTKEGFGTYTPTNNNTYTGATTVSAGKLTLGAAGSGANTPLGTTGGATAVTAGAVLDLNGYSLVTAEAITNLNGVGGGSGGFATGALINSSGTAVSFTGTITIAAGTMIRADAGAMTLSAISGSNAALILAGSTGGVVGGVIGTGTGTLTKIDTGTWNLAGANTYSGATNVYQGTLQLGATGGATNTPLGTTTSGTAIFSGAVLDLNGYTLGTAEGLSFNGFGINNGGAVVNNSASAVTYSGTRSLGSDSRTTNSGAGLLTLSGIQSGAFESRYGGAGDTTISAAIAATASSLWKDGAGILNLTAANSLTGATIVNAGTVKEGIANALAGGNLIVNGGTFDMNSFSDTVGTVTLIDGTIASTGGGVLTGTAYTLESGTISGVLTGAIAVTKNTAGVVAITGAQTLSSTLTINAGEIQLTGSGSAASVTAVTVNLGGILTLDNGSTNVADRIGAITITMNSGYFNFIGSSSTNSSETIAQLAYASGHNVVTVTPGAGGSTTLTMSNATCLNRSAGATVLYRGTSFGSNAGAGISTLLCSTPPTTTFMPGAAGAANSTTISVLKGSFGDGSLTGTGTDMVTYNVGNTNGLRLLDGAGFSGEYSATLTANTNVKLTGDVAASAVSINSLILNGYGITNASATVTIANGTSLAGNILMNSATTIAGANTVIGITTNELAVLATANGTISATIGTATTGSLTLSGSGGVTQNGANTVSATLSGANAYTGTTTINNVTLSYGASNVISSGTVTVIGGTYDLNGNSDTIGALNTTAGLTKTGAGTLTLGGTVTSGLSAILSSVIQGNLGLGANRTFVANNGAVEDDLVIPAVMSGAFTVTQNTAGGVLVLGGDNTYTGATSVSAGTMKLGANGGGTNTPLGTTAAATTVVSGAALDLNGYSLGTSEGLTINGTGVGTKGAILNTMSASVTYSGLIILGAAATIQSDYGDINISNTGSMTGTGFALTLRGAGDGTLATQVNTSTAGTIVKNDMGTWTISANSNYTGVTTITLGVLKIGADVSGTNTVLGTNAGGVTVASTAILDLQSYTVTTTETLTIAGVGLANSGALITNSGSATSWAGAVTLGATPRVSNFGSGTFTISGAISGNNALTVVNAPGDITIGTGVWSGSGTLVKEGWGATIMSGQNTMTGAMTVSTGTLRLGASGGGTNTPLGTNAGGVTVALGAVLDLSTYSLGGASTYETLNLSGTGLNNGGAIISAAAGNNSFGASTITANSRIVNSGSGTITLVGNVSIANTINLGIGGTGPTTISGAFPVTTATSATLAKWDSGLLIMSNAGNVYTGLTRIYGGTLRYGAANAVNTGGVTLAGGTLDFNGQTDSVGAIIMYSGTITDSNGAPGVLSGSSYTFYGGAISGVLGGTGIAMPKNSGSALTINKSLTNTGTLTVNGGTVQYLASNVLSNSSAMTVVGGTVDMGANSDTVAAVTLTSGSITSSTGVLTGSGYTVSMGSISAILAGAVNLTKTTTGTVVLSGTNTYTGITTIQGGALSVGTIGNGGVAGNLGQATNAAANLVFSTATGTLEYTGTSASTDRNITTTTGITMQIDVANPATTLTVSGATTNTTAPFNKVGGGTLALSGTNLHTGLTSVLSGTLKYSATNILSTGAVTVTNGILDMNGQTDSVGTVTLTNGGQIIDSAGSAGVLTSTATYALQSGFVSAKLGSAVAAGISKTTTDRVVLSGDNTFTSTSIALSAGALYLQTNNALGAAGTGLALTVTSGANLELGNSITIPSTKTFTVNGTGVVNGGAIENIVGTNTVAGAIALGATGVRINSVSGTLICNGTMTGTGFAVTFGGAGNITHAGAVNTSTAGTLTKDGTGTLTLSVGNSYTGLTTVSAGVVIANNATSFGTTAGGVTVTSGAAIEMQNSITIGAEALTLNGTGISSNGALRSTSGTNVWQGAVTLASNSSIGVDANQLTISGTITGSGAIGLTKVGAATLSVATTTVGGGLAISAGTLAASGASVITVGGNWSNSGTFTANSSTVLLNGSATQIISGTLTGTSAFNNVTITNNSGTSASDNERTGFVASVDFAASADITGTYTITTDNVRVEYNDGSTYSINNINWSASAAGNRIYFRNSVAGSGTWLLKVTGTQTAVHYVNVSRSDASVSGGSAIGASDGSNVDGTNNTNWVFVLVTTVVSGGCYTDESEGTPCTNDGSDQIKVAVNGVVESNTDATVDGAWTFNLSSTPANGAILVFYRDGETTDAEEATTVVKYDGSGDIDNVKMYQSQLVLGTDSGSANADQTITVSDLDTAANGYENSDDEDVLFDVTAGADLTVDAEGNKTEQLYIMNGDTYQPAAGGGSDTTTQNLEIDATAVITANTNAFSVAGDWTNNGTFTAGGSTVTLNGAAAQTLTTNGQAFNLLTINNTGANGTTDNITVSGNLDVNAAFTLTNGDLILNSGNPTVNTAEDVTIGSSAFVTKGSGLWTFDGDLVFTDNTSPKQDLGAVAIGTSPDTTDLASDFAATSLTVNTGDVLNSNGYDLDIGTGGINIIGTFDTTDDVETDETTVNDAGDWTTATTSVFTADQSTLILDGSSTHTISNKAAAFYNLQTNGSGTFNVGGQVTDDFERGALGGNYTTREGTPGITGSSDYNGAAADHNMSIYSNTTFAGDQWSEVTISAMSSGNEAHSCVRMNNAGPVNTYCIATDGTFFEIFRLDAGTYGATVATSTTYPVVGDTIRIEAIGTELRGYINGRLLLRGTDATYASGYPGLTVWASGVPTSTIESFAAGSILVVNNDLTNSQGVLAFGNASVAVQGGDLAVVGTVSQSSGAVTTVTTTGTVAGAGTTTFGNLYIGAGATTQTTTAGGNFSSTSLTIPTSSGANTFAASSRTITLTGSGQGALRPLVNQGVLTEGSSTIVFSGTQNTDLESEDYWNLTIAPSGGSGPTFANDPLDTAVQANLGGSLVVGNGTNAVTLLSGNFSPWDIAGDLTIQANAALNSGSDTNITIGSSYTNNGSFVDGGNGFIFDATTTGKTLAGNLTGANKFAVVFDGSGGEWTNTSAMETNFMVMNAGTFIGTANVTADYAGGTAGVINRSGGTFTVRSSGTTVFGPSTASTAWTFNNLTFTTASGSQVTTMVTSCSTCTYTVNGPMSVDTNMTLFIYPGSWSVVGSLTTTTTGSLLTSGASTVSVQGSTIGGGSGDIIFYNLTKSTAGTTTWSGTGTNAVKNDLTMSAGTLVAPSGLLAVGNFVQSGGAFTHNSGTVLLNSTTNRTLTASSSFNNLTLNDGLVGWWNLDETAGTNSADGSGYGHDGTRVNSPTIDTDVPTVNFTNARSLSFNGTSQYVNLGTQAFINSGFDDKITLSAWIKPTALSGSHVIVGKSFDTNHSNPFYDWNLFQSGNQICFRVDSSNTCSGAVLTTGWQLITGVYDGANMYLYRNGTQVNTTLGKTGNVYNGPQNARIAGRDTPGAGLGEYFAGKVDDVRIYRRALSSGEVTTLSNGDMWGMGGITWTLGAATTAVGNLSLMSGTLDTDNSNNYGLTVGGSWLNDGGIFTARAGTVTLNAGAGGKTIRTGQQNFYNLTMNNGSGGWAMSEIATTQAATVSNNLTITAGTLTSTSGVLTVGGDFNNAGTFTHNSGTVTMTGTTKNITGGSATTFNNLTISGTTGVDAAGSDATVASLLTVDNTKTLTINTGRTVTLSATSGTTLSLVGTITGAGRLTYKNTATAFPATGTISSILRMDATAGDQTIAGTNSATRTLGGLVEIYSNSSGTAKTVTLENGTARTFAFSGAINVIADNTQNLTFTADTATDPTVTVAGNIDFTGTGGGSEILVAGSGTWTASGNIDFTGGTYTATTGNKLVMNGSSKTLTSASQSLYDYEVSGGTVAISDATTISRDMILSGGTLTGPSGLTISVGRNWNKTSGSYTGNSGTVAFTTTTTATISGSNTFYNFSVTGIGAAKSVLVTAGTTQTVTGTWTVTGASGQLVTINAASAAQWNVNPSTASLDYVDISYTNNQGGGICATHSVSTSLNNTNITVTAGASCGITISGVIRQSSNETSAYDCSANTLTIGATVNGGSSATADCTLNTGVYSINAANTPSSAGDPIVVYINNGETPIGTTVTLAVDTSSNVTNLDIIDGRVVTTHENAGPMTNAKMASGDNGNAGIRYSVSSGNLLTEAGIELHVKSGKIFTPGGTVTTTATGTAAGPAGDLHIAGTLTMGTNSLTVGGDYTNAGTLNKTNTQTTTLAATGTGFTITPGTGDLNNLTVSGDSGGNGTYTLSGANLTVDGTLNVNSGDTLTIDTSRTLTNSGSTEASLGGAVNGAGTLRFVDGSGGPGTSGTLSAITRFDATNGDIASTTVDARTYSGKVELYSNSTSNRTITFPSGTITTSGGSSHVHLQANNTGDLFVDASANNPTLTVAGDLVTNGSGGGNEVLAMGNGTWTVSGNVTLTQGFTAPKVAALNPTWDNVGDAQDSYNDDGFGGCVYITTSFNCATASDTAMDAGADDNSSGATICPGPTIDYFHRAYLKYDLSSISNTNIVTGLQQQVYVTSAGTALSIGRAGNDTPDSAACNDLYNVGVSAGLNGFSDWGTGKRVVGLIPTAIQSSLGSSAYALVVHGSGPTASTIATTDDSTNKPILRVGYAAPATSPTLIMNGSGVTLNTGTVQNGGFYNLTLSGSVTVAATSTVYTYHDLTLSGTVTNNTAALAMVGDGTLVGGGNTIGNMTITSGTVTLNTSDLTLSNALVVSSGATLSLSSGRTLTHAASTFTLSGTISGAGTLTMTSASSGPGSSGTLSSLVRYDASGGNIASSTYDARTYGGAVELYANSGSARTITAPSGTFGFSGALTTTEAGAGSLTVDLNTNDPTTTITGATTIGANTTLSANSANALNVNGNYTNNGTFTDNGGTVTVAGGSQQTFAGTMTGSSDFNNLTITNNSGSDPDSSPSVIFSASSTMAGTLTATTANTKLRFAAGTTITPNAINLNGGATNSRVVLHSDTPGTSFAFTAGAGARTVSNTSIRDSSACSSTGGVIDASDGTNRDEGNSPCWLINTLIATVSGSSIGLGALTTATVSQGSVVSTITTNAPSGFISLVKYDQTLTAGSSTIPGAGGSITNGTAGYGASTSKASQTIAQTTGACSSGAGTFNATTLSTTFQSFASAAGTATGDATTLCLLATPSGSTPAGAYSSTLTIITTARF